MAMAWDYAVITPKEYSDLTYFKSRDAGGNISDFTEQRKSNDDLPVNRIEITRELALRLIEFIASNGLSTRGPIPDEEHIKTTTVSQTIYTVRFQLHLVVRQQRRWFILEKGGREPIIRDEFIAYGPVRKSGGRKHRYRRKLSYSEQNQVDHLLSITPTVELMLDWILKKYRKEIKNIDFGHGLRARRPNYR